MELKKILAGRFAGPIVKVMLESGIAKPIGTQYTLKHCDLSTRETRVPEYHISYAYVILHYVTIMWHSGGMLDCRSND